MNKSWKIALAFIVVFLAGGATAGIFTLKYVKPLPLPKPLPAPEDFTQNLMRRWLTSNVLHLSPAQKARIRPVISDTGEDMRRLTRENVHSGELIIDNMFDQIAAQLTPDQRNKLNDLIANQRQQRAKHFQQLQIQALKQQEMQQQGH